MSLEKIESYYYSICDFKQNANIACGNQNQATKTEPVDRPRSGNSAAYPSSPVGSAETQGYYYNHPFECESVQEEDMVNSHSGYGKNLDQSSDHQNFGWNNISNHWYGHNRTWQPYPYYGYVDAQRISGDESQSLQYSFPQEPHYFQPVPPMYQNFSVQRDRSDYFRTQVTDSPINMKQEGFQQVSAASILLDQNNANDSKIIPYATSSEDKENSSFENIGVSNNGTKKRKLEEDDTKPRNALSAYNFFFMEEKESIVALLNEENDIHMKQTDTTDKNRSSIISEMNVEEINAHVENLLKAADEVKLQQLKESIEEKTANFLKIHYEAHREKRSHKKRHGLISFLDLAKVIGIRWRNLPQDAKKRYFELAREDRLRFSKMG